MSSNLPRWQESALHKALSLRRVVLLVGARQCGKTTLAKTIASPSARYLTLDDITLRNLAHSDPHGFVEAPEKTLIIDEIQRAPDLLLAIKKRVDENTRAGQYLLTGSAHIQTLPTVTESLAGRVRTLRLRSLTQGEIAGRAPTFLEHAFALSFPSNSAACNRDHLLTLALSGGFPEVQKLPKEERAEWYSDYLTALLDRDLHDIAQIQRRDTLRNLIEAFAAWSGKYMDSATLQSALSIARPTFQSYVNALEALFLIERVPAWTKTDYTRIGKKPKYFMTDTGLLSALCGLDLDTVRLDSDRSGKLVESFVFHELSAQIDLKTNEYRLFCYRDRDKHEVDFLIERRKDGALLGIEVKAGSALNTKSAAGLRWFKEHIAGTRPFTGIILYTGEHATPIDKDFWAVPFSILWN